MSRPPRRPRARLHLPPLDAPEALALVTICRRIIDAVWRANGDAMAAHADALLEAKANRLPPEPHRPAPAAPPDDDDCF